MENTCSYKNIQNISSIGANKKQCKYHLADEGMCTYTGRLTVLVRKGCSAIKKVLKNILSYWRNANYSLMSIIKQKQVIGEMWRSNPYSLLVGVNNTAIVDICKDRSST